MQKEVKQTWFFKQSPQEVWEYLTNPALIGQWLAKTDFRPIVGHKFSFLDKWGKVISCEVLEVKSFSKLSYSWQYISAKDKKALDSTVVWTLVQNQHGTELQLVHSGFPALEDYTAHNNGWDTCLNRFEGLLKNK